MLKKSKNRKEVTPKYYKCNQCLGYILLSKKKSHQCETPSEEKVFENLEEDPREAWH